MGAWGVTVFSDDTACDVKDINFIACAALGVTGAKNSLNQRFTYKDGSQAQKDIKSEIKKKNENRFKVWGIYTRSNAHAHALAHVFKCDKSPEVHTPRYGHYHDGDHKFIFGLKTVYIGRRNKCILI